MQGKKLDAEKSTDTESYSHFSVQNAYLQGEGQLQLGVEQPAGRHLDLVRSQRPLRALKGREEEYVRKMRVDSRRDTWTSIFRAAPRFPRSIPASQINCKSRSRWLHTAAGFAALVKRNVNGESLSGNFETCLRRLRRCGPKTLSDGKVAGIRWLFPPLSGSGICRQWEGARKRRRHVARRTTGKSASSKERETDECAAFEARGGRRNASSPSRRIRNCPADDAISSGKAERFCASGK